MNTISRWMLWQGMRGSEVGGEWVSGWRGGGDFCFATASFFPLTFLPPAGLLTLHVVQVGAGQHLGFGLVGGHLLVDGRLHGGHAADADALPQIVAGALGPRQPVQGLPPKPATCAQTGRLHSRTEPTEAQSTDTVFYYRD